MLSKLQYRIGNGLTWRFLDSASVTETVIHLSCCSVRLSGLKSLKKGFFRVTKQIESVTGKDGVSITKKKEVRASRVKILNQSINHRLTTDNRFFIPAASA